MIMDTLTTNRSARLCERLKILFDAAIPHSPILHSTLEGKSAGRIFVDNIRDPQQCLVASGSRLVFFNASASQSFLNLGVKYLRGISEIYLVWPKSAGSVLNPPESFHGIIERLEFSRLSALENRI